MSIPHRKWKPDDIRYKNKGRICDVDGCNNTVYAKGLCHNHYELQRRTGSLIYKRDIPKPKCSVWGCKELAAGPKGLCTFHRHRAYRGIELRRPRGNKGELNIHWKGGIAQYPNHSEMKRIRKQVLEEANYICHYCGKPTNQIHHKDLTKYNHSKDNIIASCHSCNMKMAKPHTSKFKRLYGKNLRELSESMDMPVHQIRKLHLSGGAQIVELRRQLENQAQEA